MVATGGKHSTVRTALLLAVAAVAAGLAGCAYGDDAGLSPAPGASALSHPAGAPDAHLSVIQGARQGGTLLERNLDCGVVAEALVDLLPGTVSAHLIRYGDGSPAPGTGAVASVWISFTEVGP